MLLRAAAFVFVCLAAGSAAWAQDQEWEVHQSARYGVRFEIPPRATWRNRTFEDDEGQGWGYAHAFNPDRPQGERVEMFVVAREGATLRRNPEHIQRFVRAFCRIPRARAWENITPDGVDHRRWVGTRERDGQRFHVFLGETAEGVVLVILQHPVGHALDHERAYRRWYDSIEVR